MENTFDLIYNFFEKKNKSFWQISQDLKNIFDINISRECLRDRLKKWKASKNNKIFH